MPLDTLDGMKDGMEQDGAGMPPDTRTLTDADVAAIVSALLPALFAAGMATKADVRFTLTVGAGKTDGS